VLVRLWYRLPTTLEERRELSKRTVGHRRADPDACLADRRDVDANRFTPSQEEGHRVDAADFTWLLHRRHFRFTTICHCRVGSAIDLPARGRSNPGYEY
jgi:hypothetical protein